jgi:acetyltransferase-like isoleucine patch superfamily enzyme
MGGWRTHESLVEMGFRHVGRDVLVSTGAVIYRPENVSIGDHSRIDDQAMLTPGPNGFIDIGKHVYIGPACIIESPETTTLGDFATLAGRVTIYGATDDYLGSTLTNPTVPARLRGESTSSIEIGRHAIVGTHSVLLPGAHLADGVAVGAMSLVDKPLDAFGIYVGVPAKRIRDRSDKVLELEKEVD